MKRLIFYNYVLFTRDKLYCIISYKEDFWSILLFIEAKLLATVTNYGINIENTINNPFTPKG